MLNEPEHVLYVLYMAGTFALIILLVTLVVYALRKAGRRRRQRVREARLGEAAGEVQHRPSKSGRGSSDLDGYL